MGQRGRNRDGYYIALLHVLELQYERQCRVKGRNPEGWQPSPQNRPDQFLRWVLDVLENLNFPPPRTLAEVVKQLESGGLRHVARLLEHTFGHREAPDSAWTVTAYRPLGAVLHDIDQPTRSLERHPQVRKFSKVVVEQLDSVWVRALVATAREFGTLYDQPRAALLLGGLPPSFPVLSDYILGRLADCELVSQHRSLTVLQFYGLVTGDLPAPPASWERAVSELEDLPEDDILLLASLSEAQSRQLRQLTGEAWDLLRARLRLHMKSAQWRSLGESLSQGLDGVSPQVLQRLTAHLPRHGSGQLELALLPIMAALPAWNDVAQVDEELIRLIARGELSHKLLSCLQRWDDEAWSAVRTFILTDRDAGLAFMEDRQILQELFESRTGAHLHLRDLFPRTVAWLDKYLEANLEDALLNDVGELETAAAIVSRRLQEKFWAETASRTGFGNRGNTGSWTRASAAHLHASD